MCDEDKGRIADLVKEIAKYVLSFKKMNNKKKTENRRKLVDFRLGTEKECVAKELEKERNQFDTKLNQIAAQQNALIQEKECKKNLIIIKNYMIRLCTRIKHET